ncbi:hypothetical protein SAMN05444920_104281 [Nonomuraea solani]|uniref:Ig-like domain-containing protein n=1 Tax=Nonomuraea solani TaxID=1144553 RepID=A0A1H6CRG5_9ACTN|nr:hypothetical protein [Nonomuraea solani]SEG75357.1 hypothetical protein SAMN05444920_104281 [Nonomuraea solani]
MRKLAPTLALATTLGLATVGSIALISSTPSSASAGSVPAAKPTYSVTCSASADRTPKIDIGRATCKNVHTFRVVIRCKTKGSATTSTKINGPWKESGETSTRQCPAALPYIASATYSYLLDT